MKTKNILVITNLFGNDKAMVIPNFSDENVKEALSKLLQVDTKALQRAASSMGGGIYKISQTPCLKSELKPLIGLDGKDILVQLSYAHLHE